jgi:hypothetical protein
MRFVREAALAVWMLGAATPVAAESAAVDVGPWVGVLALDPHLADYRWETGVRTVWGAAAIASTRRFAAGARAWRTSTRQGTGIPGDDRALRVGLTGVEGIGEARLLSFADVRLLATASAGLLRLDWSPRELSLEDGLATAETVTFDPVHEASAGMGLALRRAVPFGFQVAVGAERTWFRMDTAHRRGAEIIEEREVFGSWTGRVEITRRLFGL